jgi:hypothetical protein
MLNLILILQEREIEYEDGEGASDSRKSPAFLVHDSTNVELDEVSGNLLIAHGWLALALLLFCGSVVCPNCCPPFVTLCSIR